MELDWSEQSPHIRSLFRLWQPGDGYDEAALQSTEERLGVRFPPLLRTFYRAWGRRQDLTQRIHALLPLEYVEIRAKTLLFWAENQATYFWGVPCETLEEADPPVVVTSPWPFGWENEADIERTPNYAQVSNMIDDLTYLHAMGQGGALHGGAFTSGESELLVAWLEESWSKARVTTRVFHVSPEAFGGSCPPLYVRDGLALTSEWGFHVAARDAEALDELGQRFQMTWSHRW